MTASSAERRVIHSAHEPAVELNDLRAELRLGDNIDGPYLQRLIAEATDTCEANAGQRLIQRTVSETGTLESLANNRYIRLTEGPIQTVNVLNFEEERGRWTPVAATAYWPWGAELRLVSDDIDWPWITKAIDKDRLFHVTYVAGLAPNLGQVHFQTEAQSLHSAIRSYAAYRYEHPTEGSNGALMAARAQLDAVRYSWLS